MPSGEYWLGLSITILIFWGVFALIAIPFWFRVQNRRRIERLRSECYGPLIHLLLVREKISRSMETEVTALGALKATHEKIVALIEEKGGIDEDAKVQYEIFPELTVLLLQFNHRAEVKIEDVRALEAALQPLCIALVRERVEIGTEYIKVISNAFPLTGSPRPVNDYLNDAAALKKYWSV